MIDDNALFSTLEAIAETLEITPPAASPDKSWALQITDYHTVYFSQARNTDHLYTYTPLLEDLPRDSDVQVKVYEALLEKNLNYANTQIGHVGFDPDLQLLLYYKRVDLTHVDEAFLLLFLPVFIESSLEWKKIVDKLVRGVPLKTKKKRGGDMGSPSHMKI